MLERFGSKAARLFRYTILEIVFNNNLLMVSRLCGLLERLNLTFRILCLFHKAYAIEAVRGTRSDATIEHDSSQRS